MLECDELRSCRNCTRTFADQLAKKFPEMRIARVDRDTMSHKGEIDDVLLTFADGGLDMLVGTQMIARDTISPTSHSSA